MPSPKKPSASRTPTSSNGRRPRRSTEAVRALILQAARELFAERGYAGATTREIAQRADTNEVLLFRHFTSKALLFEQAVFEPFKGFMQEFAREHPLQGKPEPLEEDAHDFVDGLYHVLFENRRLMMALIAATMYEPDVKSSIADIEAVHDYFRTAEQYMRGEGLDAAIGIGTGVRLSFGLIAAAVLFDDWMFAGMRKPLTPQRLIDDLSTFILSGFGGTRAPIAPAKPTAKKSRTSARRSRST